jgi:hypothetical protein
LTSGLAGKNGCQYIFLADQLMSFSAVFSYHHSRGRARCQTALHSFNPIINYIKADCARLITNLLNLSGGARRQINIGAAL